MNASNISVSPIGDNNPNNPQSTPMTEPEARRTVTAIQAHIDGARVLILDLHERRGWAALGYSSWRECVTQEFESSSQHLYRQLKAAEIERRVSPEKPIGSIPESQLRPLAALPPEKQAEAYSKAAEKSPKGQPTAKEVKAAVAEVAPKLPEPKPEPKEIRAQRAAGIIPADAVVEIIESSVPLEPIEALPADDFMGDDEWLASLAGRSKLAPNCLRRFDADALAFRRITPPRLKYVFATRAITKAQRQAGGGLGAWLGRHLNYLQLRDPSQWLPCHDCKGSGLIPVIGECPKCRGNGYVI